MAARGSATRRVPGNPMAGVLRDMSRRSRAPMRRAGRAAAAEGRRGSEVLREVRAAASVAVVVATGEDGRAVWAPPLAVGGTLVVTATPAGARPLLAVVEEATAGRIVVRVWRPDGGPAGGGVPVHLTATPAGSD